MIRERILALGKDSIYNLTGLVRTATATAGSRPLENQFTYYPLSRSRRRAGAALYGCRPAHVQRRPVQPRQRSHAGHHAGYPQARGPCPLLVARDVAPFGATGRRGDGAIFQEVQGLAALEQAMHGAWHMLAITPLTPSMYHLPAADVAAAIDMARAARGGLRR